MKRNSNKNKKTGSEAELFAKMTADELNETGMKYVSGYDATQDMEKGVRYLRAAIEKGSAQAEFDLAVCYQDGLGVRVDWEEAFELYRSSARQGHNQAIYNVAFCFKNGIGVQRGYESVC